MSTSRSTRSEDSTSTDRLLLDSAESLTSSALLPKPTKELSRRSFSSLRRKLLTKLRSMLSLETDKQKKEGSIWKSKRKM